MYKWQDWSVKRYSTKLLVHGHTDIQVQECATSIKHDSSIQLQECLTSKIVKWVLSNGFPILIEKNMFPVQQTLYRSKWSMTDIDQEISRHHHHFSFLRGPPPEVVRLALEVSISRSLASNMLCRFLDSSSFSDIICLKLFNSLSCWFKYSWKRKKSNNVQGGILARV